MLDMVNTAKIGPGSETERLDMVMYFYRIWEKYKKMKANRDMHL